MGRRTWWAQIALLSLRALPILLSGRVLEAQSAAASDSLVVTLLGTGTPNPRIAHLGPSTLVEAGGKRLLFDAGRGTTIRLEQAGIRTASVTATFLTHLHSDHVNGLPDVWLTGWLPPFGGRATPVRLYGPTGTRELARGLETAFAADLRIRSAEEGLPRAGVAFEVTEFARDTTVFEESGVRVRAFLVDHGGQIKPALGYRVDYAGRSVVISGDTRYSPNLVANARGADVVVHEVAMAPAEIADRPPVRYILSIHTAPADVARVFTQVRPRLAVLTHLAIPANPGGRALTPADVLAETRRGYAGAMELGEDLMRISVTDSVRVRRGPGASPTRP
jgi:ribonuclease Z